jgi:hypothetical protein
MTNTKGVIAVLIKIVAIAFILFSFHTIAQTQEEKEAETVDFSSVKTLLQQDGLTKELEKNKNDVMLIQAKRLEMEKSRTNYPSEDDFWAFFQDYWLVKNAARLQWDVPKPDFGLGESFAKLLGQVGQGQKKFQILIVNSPEIPHASLPAANQLQTYIVSLPFIRTLDLSRLEISLLLFEDYIREQKGYVKKEIVTDRLSKMFGGSFFEGKPDYSVLDTTNTNLMNFYTTKGFSFQQQFEVTKSVDQYLKSQPELWNAYIRLLNKIDRLLKTNELFNNYNKIYPSPEIQIKWLTPEAKIL